jgi:hypothetical protein
MGKVSSRYGESRNVNRVLWQNLRERDHLEDPGVGGRIFLVIQKVGCGAWAGFI